MKLHQHETREQWLNAAVDLLRPVFKERAKVTLPKKIRISCGFPSGGRRSRAVGECWSKASSTDETFEIFVSPRMDDEMKVLGTVAHECAHAGVGLDKKHGPVFKAAGAAILLEGPPKSMGEGKEFIEQIGRQIVKALGEYPHASLKGGLSSGPKKQSTRLLKVFCRDCNYTMRITAKWLMIGTPDCPNSGCGRFGKAMEAPVDAGDAEEEA
jgi:hypothetical protein